NKDNIEIIFDDVIIKFPSSKNPASHKSAAKFVQDIEKMAYNVEEFFIFRDIILIFLDVDCMCGQINLYNTDSYDFEKHLSSGGSDAMSTVVSSNHLPQVRTKTSSIFRQYSKLK